MDVKTLHKNRNTLLLVVIIVVSVGLLSYVFLGNQLSHIFTNTKQTETKLKNYPTLDKNLNAVINAPNLKQDAATKGLAVDKNGIKVLITLKDESFAFTTNYGIQQLRYGKHIQAIVKFEELENIAKNPKINSIASIRASNKPLPTFAPSQ